MAAVIPSYRTVGGREQVVGLGWSTNIVVSSRAKDDDGTSFFFSRWLKRWKHFGYFEVVTFYIVCEAGK